MRYRRSLLPTVKEAPSDASTASHALLTRAGYVRRVGAGIYSFLPLGVRVLKNIERIVVEEMDRAGGEQVLLPALLPAEYLRESGRWEVFGQELIRLKDRKGGDYHLGPTHEEIITDLARREIHSYRDLPKNLYQVQTKFRDEPRPRAGLLRCREFLMKDAYSFDEDEAGAEVSYRAMRDAYTRIFDRTGLTYRRVAADAGSMGGSKNEEFQVLVHSGEDVIIACEACDYAANREVALSASSPVEAAVEDQSPPAPELVETPNQRSIEEVSASLGLPPSRLLKSLVYRAKKRLVLAVVRGDHELNEDKLMRQLGVDEIELAGADAVVEATGAPVGFAGPVGFSGEIFVDSAARDVPVAACGANAADAHLKNVVFGRDYEGKVCDLRSARDGDACIECGGTLRQYRGIEAGHIFLLGTRYSQAMGATFLDKDQKKRVLWMGCYGVGVSRLVAAAVEQHHDEMGICWPISIAPYQVHLTQLGKGEAIEKAVSELERGLEAAGIQVLVDDRDERPGVKFKDADLIGIPIRLTLGDRGLKSGVVELKLRVGGQSESIPLGEAVAATRRHVDELLAQDQAKHARAGSSAEASGSRATS